MQRTLSRLTLACILAGLGLSACQPGKKPETAAAGGGELGAGAVPAPQVDYRQLASRLVTQSLRARPGEFIFLYGSPRDLELLENLAVETRSRAAWPLLTIGTDRLTRMNYTEVPTERDADRPELSLALGKLFTGGIYIETGEANDLLADIPAARFQARAAAARPVNEALRKVPSRQVFLGNGMYPNDANARQFGMTRPELAQLFWDGINIDYDQLQATGQTLRQRLASGRQVHLTNPNGTDVHFSIAGRDPGVSDGVISDEDARRGYATRNVYLPAGEVYVTIVPGSAEGRITTPEYWWEGSKVEDLALEIQKGRVTSLTAKGGGERIRQLFDAAGSGKDLLSILDIGINPNVRPPAGGRFQGWVPAGTATLSIGGDTWAGGTNDVGFGLPVFLPGSTVTLDDQPIIQNGQLVTSVALAAPK